jgi:1-deoxy-D-xylulose-5-phosphate synthase
VLKAINGPEDMRRLSIDDLKVLCQELRGLILETVLKNGGHLAASLGAVELIVALHRVFSSPIDALVFDVGHQAYAHKILTYRRDTFHTLRHYGGLSPFPKREESPHDAFGVGHAGTAISAALGILEGKRRQKQEGRVVAVVGDGGLTSGMSFEALNQEDHLKEGLIIVLNDNAMSISKNVGALASFFSKALLLKPVLRLEAELKGLLKKNIPLREPLYYLGKSIKEGLVSASLDVGLFFQSLGFQYVGPLNGHDLSELVWAFERVKILNKPMLVHVRTQKGKGYGPSEKDPCAYHGVSFKSPQKLPSSSGVSYSKIFGDTMVRLAKEDPKILAITAAMPDGTGLRPFFDQFPDRAYDVGICEQHAVTLAAGLATQGLRPVVAIYSTFLQRAYDQVVHDVCLQNLPVTFVMDRAGLVGEDGPTHHGVFDISFLRPIPNLVLASPRDGAEFILLLKTAIRSNRPFFIRIPKAKPPERANGSFIQKEGIPIGTWEVLQTGRRLALFGSGRSVEVMKSVAIRLQKAGLFPIIVNARFIKPYDEPCLRGLLGCTSAWVSLEDGIKAGGLGTLLAEYLADSCLSSVRLLRLGIEDCFVPHGSLEDLERGLGLEDSQIASRIMEWLKESQWAKA